MPNKIKDLTEQQCDNLMILGDPKNYAYPDINQQNLNIFLNQSVEYLPYDINIEKPDVRSRFKLAMWNIKEKEKQIFIFYRRTQNQNCKTVYAYVKGLYSVSIVNIDLC